MKKCPYCAEEIRDEAVICSHCGRDLTGKPRSLPAFASLPVQTERDPSVLTTLFITLLIVILVDFGLAYSVLNWTGDYRDWTTPFAGLTMVLRFLVGYIAVKEFKPFNPKAIHYILMIILSYVPIASLVPAFFAGKAIARRVTPRLAWLVFLLIGAVLFSRYIIIKTGFDISFMQDMPAPTQTSVPTPTTTTMPATSARLGRRSRVHSAGRHRCAGLPALCTTRIAPGWRPGLLNRHGGKDFPGLSGSR